MDYIYIEAMVSFEAAQIMNNINLKTICNFNRVFIIRNHTENFKTYKKSYKQNKTFVYYNAHSMLTYS